jgi:hypothetical protein
LEKVEENKRKKEDYTDEQLEFAQRASGEFNYEQHRILTLAIVEAEKIRKGNAAKALLQLQP